MQVKINWVDEAPKVQVQRREEVLFSYSTDTALPCRHTECRRYADFENHEMCLPVSLVSLLFSRILSVSTSSV